MKTFREAEERLAQSLATYESRPQQQALAAAIEAALADGTHLLGEAGCGTGKSFGYLIPAILSGKRVVISTATKALQDQIAGGDLPFLAEHLGVPFTFALLKGRSNYLCLNKAMDADPSLTPNKAAILRATEDPEFDGDRESFGFDIEAREWMQVAADSEDCQALDCKHNGQGCYAQRARERALLAQIVVVNHALLFTDLIVRERSGGYANLLAEYDAVIFDEAHEAEEYASGALGAQFSEGTIRGLTTEVHNFVRQIVPESLDAVGATIARLLGATTALWGLLEPGRIQTADLLAAEEEYVEVALALQALADDVAGLTLDGVRQADAPAARKRLARLEKRSGNAAERFVEVMTADFAEVVRWVEVETRRDIERKVIRTAPVNVGTYLRTMLFEVTPTVLVSATLSVHGAFDYIAGRLGIDDFRSIDVGTPFDYSTQSLLYVPRHLPSPKEAMAWGSMAVAEIGDLVKASDGRALLLFTSNRQMRQAYDVLAPRLPYTCLKQGDAPNKVLARQFAEDTHSVLFATRSFFTGVDFQGDACSLVVIDKLPFPVPNEPIVEARCEAILRAGGNDFADYTIPVMSLILKQAFGRLIRHRNDRGVVAILDNRLVTQGYGKKIVRSLPNAPLVTDGAAVAAFFEGVAA